MIRQALFTLLCIGLLVGCKKDEGGTFIHLSFTKYDTPKGFPPVEFPEDNFPTFERIALGKKLFFDVNLSRDSTVSCASCHQSQYGLADNLSLSDGVFGRKGFRNSPSLLNVAYQEKLMMDGGVATLEMQVEAPLTDHLEMDMTGPELIERLEQNEEYMQLFREAYPDRHAYYIYTRALACFERSLVSANSVYDSWLLEGIELGQSQERGRQLFFSERTNCSSCHSGFLFSDQSFRSNGLYTNYADPGRARVTELAEDQGTFKVPSLRNIASTAPYMHNGSLSSLKEVIEHYNSGGADHPNKDFRIKALNLNEQDQRDLVNFLKTLTDKSIQISP